MENKIYWIWLQLACGPASTLPKRLLNRFNNDINEIYSADRDDLDDIKLTPRQTKALCDKSLDMAQEIIDWCDKKKVGILCYDDPQYPQRLRSIADAPTVLYYIGELYPIDSMLCLGGVGTRRATTYGRESAYAYSYEMARCGAVIVSGLAAGIDTACHRAALDAGGKTIAVIGCRIDKVYPAENRDIMREIARKGLLITEFHPFYKTSSANFPLRNRIISALCQGVVVYEADTRSGSLITAKLAKQQDRKIYALPGRVGEVGSLGTNTLIRDGAALVSSPYDILEEYKFSYDLNFESNWIPEYSGADPKKDSFTKSNHEKKGKKPKEIKAEEHPPVEITDELQLKIYNTLNNTEPMPVELISIEGQELSDIMSALTMLELMGLIVQHPGNTYTKKY